MDDIQNKYIIIEKIIYEIKDLIFIELGSNPYQDLDKILKIVSQKNYKEVLSIKSKIKNLSILLYNRSLKNNKYIFSKLDEIYLLINENPKS